MSSYPAALLRRLSLRSEGVVHLPARGRRRGTVLLSYLTGPFTRFPGQHFTDPHTNYWECAEISRLLQKRGYDVDVIDASAPFTPKRTYDVIIDVGNFDRFGPLPEATKLIAHLTTAHPTFQDAGESRRLAALKERRGCILPPHRFIGTAPDYAHATYLEGFGNRTIHATYGALSGEIVPIPISVTEELPFPHAKDWTTARTSFIWFGGGGAILKGLDLVVEAFASMPELTLHVVGPAAFEPEFEACYAKELSLANIVRHPRPKLGSDGRIYLDGLPLSALFDRCIALVYPTASDGTSGSVIQAVHAGLIPLLTEASGTDPAIGGMRLPSDPSVTQLQEAVRIIARQEPAQSASMARVSWEFVRVHHTREAFSAAYAQFLDTHLS